MGLKELLEFELAFLAEVIEAFKVDFGEDDEDWLVLEEGLEALEKLDLFGDGIAASFRDIDEEEHAGLEVGEGSDSLHFDCASLV